MSSRAEWETVAVRRRPDDGPVPAVRVREGMKPKHLPEYFAPIFEQKIAGTLGAAGMEPLRFKGGRFFSVEWVLPRRADGSPEVRAWPEPVETAIEPGSFIVAFRDFTVRAFAPEEVEVVEG